MQMKRYPNSFGTFLEEVNKAEKMRLISKKYYVYGGEYENTQFLFAKTYETYGPFDTYQLAYDKWKERSFQTVDNCHYRFTVLYVP
jgi:predicted patatin/cPLA2 family phospholipase